MNTNKDEEQYELVFYRKLQYKDHADFEGVENLLKVQHGPDG
jgi:hypothetical protein